MAIELQAHDLQEISPVDALWTIIKGQSKTVRHALAKRLNDSIKEEKDRAKIKMTEKEFYEKLDRSIQSAQNGSCQTMEEEETGAQFIERILSNAN